MKADRAEKVARRLIKINVCNYLNRAWFSISIAGYGFAFPYNFDDAKRCAEMAVADFAAALRKAGVK